MIGARAQIFSARHRLGEDEIFLGSDATGPGAADQKRHLPRRRRVATMHRSGELTIRTIGQRHGGRARNPCQIELEMAP